MNLSSNYRSREKEFSETASALESKYMRFSFIRLLIFIIAIGGAILLFNSVGPLAGVVFIILFLVLFSKFVFWHQDIQQSQYHHERLAKINKQEQQYLNYEYNEFESGQEFFDALHPYTMDLDIFGDYSFFQYMSRCTTAIGKKRLSHYLENVAPVSEIILRQEAINELSQKLEWRQHFQAYGMASTDDIRYIDALKSWLEDPIFVNNNKLLKAALWLAPIWMILGIYLYVMYLPTYIALLFLVPPGLILKSTLEQVNQAQARTENAGKMLAYYSGMISHIEQESFQSAKLQHIQQTFLNKENRNASVSIKRLSYIISQLNLRLNIFAILINLFALWDLHWVNKLEQWKAVEKEKLPDWFGALAEMEALLSFAGLYYNNPEFHFPEIQEDHHLEGVALGHPLLDAKKRVCNDLETPTHGHLKLITGSNMAGKSTFLRTVGINIVLAMAGSPVCAKKLKLPPLQVYSSMRTQDALHESTSSFYAELKRLKVIIEAVENGDNIYFLMDEILKGTNSRDRHTGSKALISQLIKSKGAGIIATHDLELGELEAHSGGSVENLCLEVEVKGSELLFDYTVKKGVSQSFNATHLMKNMGIRIED